MASSETVHPETIRGGPFLFGHSREGRKMVKNTVSVGVKMSPDERKKLAHLANKTGLSASAVIRTLIVQAEAAPVVWVPSLGGGGQ